MRHLSIDGKNIANALIESGYFSADDAQPRQVIAMGEEVGEFIGAARRFMGWARRNGTREEMEMELADVIITAYVTAAVFDIKIEAVIERKLREIYSRGWKNE